MTPGDPLDAPDAPDARDTEGAEIPFDHPRPAAASPEEVRAQGRLDAAALAALAAPAPDGGPEESELRTALAALWQLFLARLVRGPAPAVLCHFPEGAEGRSEPGGGSSPFRGLRLPSPAPGSDAFHLSLTWREWLGRARSGLRGADRTGPRGADLVLASAAEAPSLLDLGGGEEGGEPADLCLCADPADPGSVALIGRADLFEAETLKDWLRRLGRLARSAAERPEAPVAALDLLEEDELRRMLLDWNIGHSETGRTPGEAAPLVHEATVKQGRRRPDAVAFVGPAGEHFTFGRLLERSEALALYLRRRGVGADSPVALLGERSFSLLVGFLAVLRAGGCYVPFDPVYPDARIAGMLADSGAWIFLFTGRQAHRRPAFEEILPELGRPPLHVVLDEEDASPPAWQGARSEEGAAETYPADRGALDRESLDPRERGLCRAYVTYTSGSTGTPKGVQVVHGAIARFSAWQAAHLGCAPEQGYTHLSGPAFDAAAWEIWPAWTSGVTLHTPDPAVRVDPEKMQRWLLERGITGGYQPAALAEELMRLPWPPAPSYRFLATGAEKIHGFPPTDLPLRVSNNYGPTETTVLATSDWIPPTDEPTGFPSIGKPLATTLCYVVDPRLRLVPPGVPGELALGGPNLARGYLRRPGRTAVSFVPDPFPPGPFEEPAPAERSGKVGQRIYRTGDLVRWLPDGRLEFLGRIDFQVQIRGFRVELGEVEVHLKTHPAVRDVVVLAGRVGRGEDGGWQPLRGGAADGLAAYIIPDDPAAASADSEASDALADELRAHLAERVPAYMVPAFLVFLEAFPLNANGKIDRRGMPAPEGAKKRPYLPPRTPTEELIAGLAGELLGLERVGVDESLLDLGLHSLSATRLLSRVDTALGVRLEQGDLFRGPTVAELAGRVDEARREGARRDGTASEARPPLEGAAAGSGPLPLSHAQERAWLIQRLDPDSPIFNLSAFLHAEGRLDVAALSRALAEITRRHQALRTAYVEIDDAPRQVVRELPSRSFPIPAVDLSRLTRDDRRRELPRLGRAEGRRSFDLTRAPMARALLYLRAEGRASLQLSFHHIATDGWSVGITIRELTALYRAYHRGEPSPLDEPPVQYADYALWQRSWLDGAVADAQLAYWRQELAGAKQLLALPTDRPRRPNPSRAGRELPIAFDPDLVEEVHALARREGVTLFMALASVWTTLLGRLAGQDDVLIASPVANRTQEGIESLIGFFVNTLVIRARLTEGGEAVTFRRLLARFRETALGAYANQDLPFQRLIEDLPATRGNAFDPLVQAMLVLQNAPAEALELPEVELDYEPVDLGIAQFDLLLSLGGDAADLGGYLGYRTALFDPATVERWSRQLAVLLRGLVARPELPVSDVPLLGEEERAQVFETPGRWWLRGLPIDRRQIEAALTGQEGVKEAVVLLRTDREKPSLTAYLVPAAPGGLTPGPLRAALAAELPDHMVPAAFVVLDALPRQGGPESPVDEAALPAPADEQSEGGDEEARQRLAARQEELQAKKAAMSGDRAALLASLLRKKKG